MIAYDLDGVFTSDLVYTEDKIDHLLYFRHNHTLPIFEPSGPFYVITGRPIKDEPHTLAWIDKYWKHKPLKVFHGNEDFTLAIQYKAKVLIENPDIHVFIESCENQVRSISKLVAPHRHVTIIHFPELVRGAIQSVARGRYEVLP